MISVGAPSANPSTRDGHRASQPPSGARPESRSRPLLDSRATFSPDGGDPAPRVSGYPSLLPGPRADAPRGPGHQKPPSSPQSRFASLRPARARAPDRRAGSPGVPHRAAASAGEPPTSGPAGRHGLGGHLEFIEPAAAGVITAQIYRSWYQGGSPGSRSRWAPPGQRQ
ncbi:hypothetical protein NDU88_007200 [Pleurodeles waltl]|uniref:Uncharacterized protein n=1 Tax=Pleurodeles waltl TaxID=8319 RepID=A0AAV7VQ16_PLEWA|nr:hypothetical protein NDU88_007200 [Pleurodeles waltl]